MTHPDRSGSPDGRRRPGLSRLRGLLGRATLRPSIPDQAVPNRVVTPEQLEVALDALRNSLDPTVETLRRDATPESLERSTEHKLVHKCGVGQTLVIEDDYVLPTFDREVRYVRTHQGLDWHELKDRERQSGQRWILLVSDDDPHGHRVSIFENRHNPALDAVGGTNVDGHSAATLIFMNDGDALFEPKAASSDTRDSQAMQSIYDIPREHAMAIVESITAGIEFHCANPTIFSAPSVG